MDANGNVVGVVVGTTVGVAAALVTAALVKVKQEKDAQAEETALAEQTHEAYLAGYNEGWRDFGKSETHVRGAYAKFNETPDPEAGLTTKARKSNRSGN